MEKKELILTVAKDLLTAYKPELSGALGENKVDAIGKYLSKVVKQVEQIYNEIAD